VGEPLFRQRLAWFAFTGFQRGGGPFGIGLAHQRQVEQPLTGIVDDVDVQLRALQVACDQTGGFVLDGQAQL
jgi:hypothetical protein